MTTNTVRRPVPCSLCGHRDYNMACERCKIRLEVDQGTLEDREKYNEYDRLRQAHKLAGVFLNRPLESALITVALVGCSKQKTNQDGRCNGGVPAKNLYVGRLCQLGYRYAQSQEWNTHFISALHGLLPPTQLVVPYDFSMSHLKQHERDAWGNRVVTELLSCYPLQPLRIVFLAGMTYIRPILEAFPRQHAYWEYEVPLAGLDLFGRLRWFKAHVQP